MADAPFTHLITSEEELREAYAAPPARAWEKEIDRLDEHCADFLTQAPLAMLATSGADGLTTVTPRGGPPGFLRVLDPHRLAWADLTGNRRVDAFRHILENPEVGLLVLLPGMRETLRIDGTAYLTRDPAVLRAVDVPDRTADLAVGLHVRVAFLQCGKAMIRSRVWEPESWPEKDALPSAADMFRAARQHGETRDEVEHQLAESYSERLW